MPSSLFEAVAIVLASLPSAVVAYIGLRKGRQSTEKVHAQLVPNGGSSLRDAINRIESDITDLRVGVQYLNNRVDHDQNGARGR